MFDSMNREELRTMMCDAWQKYKNKLPMTPLETQITDVINLHPEYQKFFDAPGKYKDKDYLPELGEVNPFLHVSLHISIREQVGTDRPAGIQQLYQQLVVKHQGDHHTVEHRMFEVLIEMMCAIQRGEMMYDDNVYLEKLKAILR